MYLLEINAVVKAEDGVLLEKNHITISLFFAIDQ